MPGAPRIRPKHRRRIYLAEWRKNAKLTQQQLGEMLGVAAMTVSRWERGAALLVDEADDTTALLSTDVMAAIAEAFNIEPADLYRHPDEPSIDALLRHVPLTLRQKILARVINELTGLA